MPDLTLWTASEILRMRRELDRQFASLCEDFGPCGPSRGSFGPEVRMAEEGDALVVRLGFPEASCEDLSVNLEGDVLLVTCARQTSATDARGGHFSRSAATLRLRLPCPVDPDSAVAEYKDDELTVTLPRCASRSIPLKVRRA